jgi:hypothetical protein
VSDQTAQLIYRLKVLPHQLARARERLRQLESEARRYGMLDLIDADPTVAPVSPDSGPAPLGRSGAARVAPARGAIGGER